MEAALNFTKQGSVYVAKAKASSNYSLHIERARPGVIQVAVRSTSQGEYSQPQTVYDYLQQGTFDCDFTHGNISDECPKYLQFSSETPVTTAYIVGENVEALV